MAADRARADEEDLKVSSFQKGGWEQTRPTELDIDYALLADALGSGGAPVAEVHDATVVALAYVTGAQRGAGGGPARVGGWRFGEVGSCHHLAPRYAPGDRCGGDGFTRHGDGGLHDGAPFFVQNRANDQKRAMLKVWKISFQTCFAMAHGR